MSNNGNIRRQPNKRAISSKCADIAKYQHACSSDFIAYFYSIFLIIKIYSYIIKCIHVKERKRSKLEVFCLTCQF